MYEENYKFVIDIAKSIKDAGLTGVVVYKPEVNADAGDPEWADVIVCTHSDPAVITALLGN